MVDESKIEEYKANDPKFKRFMEGAEKIKQRIANELQDLK